MGIAGLTVVFANSVVSAKLEPFSWKTDMVSFNIHISLLTFICNIPSLRTSDIFGIDVGSAIDIGSVIDVDSLAGQEPLFLRGRSDFSWNWYFAFIKIPPIASQNMKTKLIRRPRQAPYSKAEQEPVLVSIYPVKPIQCLICPRRHNLPTGQGLNPFVVKKCLDESSLTDRHCFFCKIDPIQLFIKAKSMYTMFEILSCEHILNCLKWWSIKALYFIIIYKSYCPFTMNLFLMIMTGLIENTVWWIYETRKTRTITVASTHEKFYS